jgi:hypothetical protein
MNNDIKSEKQKRESGILKFFSRLLPKSTEVAATVDKEYTTMGKSEPTISDAVLHELNKYIDAVDKKGNNDIVNAKSSITASNFAPLFETKRQKVIAYKMMANYPEINKAINIVANTAIATDENGEIIKLKFKNEDIPEAVQSQMQGVLDYLIYEVFDIEEDTLDLFKKFLIEGELYVELVTDGETNNIIDYHILPSYSTIPIYKDGTNTISGYVQYSDIIVNGVPTETDSEAEDYMGVSGKDYESIIDGVYGVSTYTVDDGREKDQQIEFLPNQVAYANYGQYSSSVYDVSGYLEPIRKTYNILSTLDDALAIYRFVRAPETRLWNVFTKGLPPTKADEFLDTVIDEFRKDYSYNPGTGEFNQTGVFNSIVDEYFFSVDESGNKTSVESLSGAMNLDQLEDYEIQKEKLMAGLQIPRSRWDRELMRDWTARNETTTGEEQQFSLFVDQLKRNFVQIFRSPFETLCRLNGIEEKYLRRSMYKLEFSARNSWKFWQDMEVLKTKSETFDALKNHMRSADNEEAPLAPGFVFKKVFDLSKADEELNEFYMKEYEDLKNNVKKSQAAEDYEIEYEDEDKRTNFDYGRTFLYGADIESEFAEDEIESDINIFSEEPEEVEDRPNFKYGGKYTYGVDTVAEAEEPETNFYDFDYSFEEEEEDEEVYDFGQKYLYGASPNIPIIEYEETGNSLEEPFSPREKEFYEYGADEE